MVIPLVIPALGIQKQESYWGSLASQLCLVIMISRSMQKPFLRKKKKWTALVSMTSKVVHAQVHSSTNEHIHTHMHEHTHTYQ